MTPNPPGHETSPLRQHYFELLNDPLGFVSDVSGLISATDPRTYSAFGEQEPVVELGSFVEMVSEDPGIETTVLLHVLAALAPSDPAARAAAAATTRSDSVPDWVAGLADAEVAEVAWMVDALGEAGNYLLEVHAAAVPVFTMVVYVDRVAGPIVKDAFFVEGALATVREQMLQLPGAEQFVWREVDPGALRGIVERGIELSAMLEPPIETDSWPMARAMTEWIVRLIPDVVEPEERDPDLAAQRVVVDQFLESVHGNDIVRDGVPEDAAIQIGEMLAAYAVGSGTGDALEWSPRMVEDLLERFWPNQVIAPHLDEWLRVVLVAWVEFAHAETGVPAEWSRPVVEAVGIAGAGD